MIPYEFNFYVYGGTGMAFHAILSDDFENYNITFEGGKCQFSVKEVLRFLSKGIWRQA